MEFTPYPEIKEAELKHYSFIAEGYGAVGVEDKNGSPDVMEVGVGCAIAHDEEVANLVIWRGDQNKREKMRYLFTLERDPHKSDKILYLTKAPLDQPWKCYKLGYFDKVLSSIKDTRIAMLGAIRSLAIFRNHWQKESAQSQV